MKPSDITYHAEIIEQICQTMPAILLGYESHDSNTINLKLYVPSKSEKESLAAEAASLTGRKLVEIENGGINAG